MTPPTTAMTSKFASNSEKKPSSNMRYLRLGGLKDADRRGRRRPPTTSPLLLEHMRRSASVAGNGNNDHRSSRMNDEQSKTFCKSGTFRPSDLARTLTFYIRLFELFQKKNILQSILTHRERRPSNAMEGRLHHILAAFISV